MSIKHLHINIWPDDGDSVTISKFPNSMRFKKSKAPKAPAGPSLSDKGKEWEGRTYDVYERMINGGGMTGLEGQQLDELLKETDKGFLTASRNLDSSMSRSVKAGDERVLQYGNRALSQSHATAKADLKTANRMQLAQDAELGLDSGMDALANAKRMSASLTQQYNNAAMQYNQNQQNYGTFASQLGQGLGAAAGWMNAAQSYSQMMSNNSSGTINTPATVPLSMGGGMNSVAPQAYSRFMGGTM